MKRSRLALNTIPNLEKHNNIFRHPIVMQSAYNLFMSNICFVSTFVFVFFVINRHNATIELRLIYLEDSKYALLTFFIVQNHQSGHWCKNIG